MNHLIVVRRIRETAKKFADEAGAGEALFESVIIELMKRGWEPERAKVNALIAELSR